MKKSASSLENTPRVLALAIAFFGGMAALAWLFGTFERFDRFELAALGLFALAFAALTAVLDPGVRSLVQRAIAPRARKSSSRRPAIS